MLDLTKFEMKCNWNKDIICKGRHLCQLCEHQPPDDEKPNGKNPPVKISWEASCGGTWPQCPSCGEMPYSMERCVFCGQKFIQEDEALKKYSEPEPVERMDCFICGGKGTMIGRRARGNGHFHGQCEKCGAQIME